jgi:hypothetical protein
VIPEDVSASDRGVGLAGAMGADASSARRSAGAIDAPISARPTHTLWVLYFMNTLP